MKNIFILAFILPIIAISGRSLAADQTAPHKEQTIAEWTRQAITTIKTVNFNEFNQYPQKIKPLFGETDEDYNNKSGYESYMRAFSNVFDAENVKKDHLSQKIRTIGDIEVIIDPTLPVGYYRIISQFTLTSHWDRPVTGNRSCRLYMRDLDIVVRDVEDAAATSPSGQTATNTVIMRWIEGAKINTDSPCPPHESAE